MKFKEISRKKLIIVASIVLSGLLILFILHFISDIPGKEYSIFRAIPQDASFVLIAENCDALSEATAMFEPVAMWNDIPIVKDVFDEFRTILQTIASDKNAASLAKDARLATAVINHEGEHQFLFAVEMNLIPSFSDISAALDPVVKPLGFIEKKERKGDHRFELINEKDSIFIGHLGNILILSAHTHLVQASLRQLQAEQAVSWESFKDELSVENTLFTVYSLDGSLHAYLEQYFQRNSYFPFFIFPDSGSIAFIRNNEHLNLQLKGRFQNEIPDFPVDFPDLYQWRNAIADVAGAGVVTLTNSPLPEQILSYLNPIAYEFLIQPQPGEKNPHSLLLVSVRDTTTLFRKMGSIIAPLPDETAKEFDFQNYKAAMLKNDSIFQHIPAFHNLLPPNRLIVLCENTLLISPYAGSIEKALAEYEFSRLDTLNEYQNLNEFNFFIHLPRFYPYLLVSAQEEKRADIENIYAVLARYTRIEFFSDNNTHNRRQADVIYDRWGPHSPLSETAEQMLSLFDLRNNEVFSKFLTFPAEMYDDFEDGNKNFFYPDSIIMAQGIYEAGKATGTWRFYNPDSSYAATVEFDNNLPHGRAVFYRPKPEGKMLVSCAYEKGKLEGQYIVFHKNGKPALSLIIKQGKISGKVRCYYPSGTIMAELDINEPIAGKRYLFYTLTGDFIDPEILNASALILSNYKSFINTNRISGSK